MKLFAAVAALSGQATHSHWEKPASTKIIDFQTGGSKAVSDAAGGLLNKSLGQGEPGAGRVVPRLQVGGTTMATVEPYGEKLRHLRRALGMTQLELASSDFDSTAEPLNKRPVTATYFHQPGIMDCRSSLNGGPHAVSNFRSDHPGGGQFLMCDGSVHFVGADIDLVTYRRLSTISEDAPATLP